jgi:hypothetical protein
MNSDILKEKNIVDRILSDLSKYGEIPNKGFLSGGAVANTLMGYVWGGEYPINDLDIFIDDTDNMNVFRHVGTPLRSNKLIIEGDGYMVTKLSYDHGSNYQIVSVGREGFLNTIFIHSARQNVGYSYILNGFDFNCCQVGIDLDNNTICYTESFENFLDNKQLEVTAIYTPAHTAIRLFKKLDELKCYCNVEESMNLLSQPLLMENLVHLSRRQFGLYFSTKYKEMYFTYYSKIREYFKLTKFFDHKKDLWCLRNGIKQADNSDHVTNWLNPNANIPTEVLSNWAKNNDIMWTLTPKKYVDVDSEIRKVLFGVSYNPLTFMNAYNIVKGKTNKKLKAKAEKVVMGDYYLCKVISLVDNNFYNCDFDSSHVKELESFMDKDRWVVPYIAKNRLNLQESLILSREIKKVYSNDGEWVSELVANYLNTVNKFYKVTYESIVEGIKKDKEKFCVNLFEPLDFSDLTLPEGVKIKELITELDLQWAGNKLKNCMNNSGQNYKDRIIKGDTKLLVIITPNNMSGLELRLVEDSVYKEIQLLSYCNRVSSEYHRIISNIFTNYLNMLHLRKTYESKVNNFVTIDMMNRSSLVNVKDEDTSKNKKNFGGEELPIQEPDWAGERVRDILAVQEQAPMNERFDLGEIRNDLDELLNEIGDPIMEQEQVPIVHMVRDDNGFLRRAHNQNEEYYPHNRNIRMELEALLPNIHRGNEVRDNEIDNRNWTDIDEFPIHRA